MKELPEVGRFPSNGLLVLGPQEALLIDTAWTVQATVLLLGHVERVYRRRVTHVIVTHSHDDRAIGIRQAQRRGARVHGLALTSTRTAAAGFGTPSDTFEQSAIIELYPAMASRDRRRCSTTPSSWCALRQRNEAEQ